jgi:flagellar export protein FliJ
MQKFRFRLQKLLELAKKRADAARREAGRALTALTAAEEKVVAARAACTAAARELEARLLEGAVDAIEIMHHHAHARRLDAFVRTTEERATTARLEYERASAEAAERRREELLLERARENRLETWREEAKKAELEFMEETASVRWMRNAARRES